MIVIDDLGGS